MGLCRWEWGKSFSGVRRAASGMSGCTFWQRLDCCCRWKKGWTYAGQYNVYGIAVRRGKTWDRTSLFQSIYLHRCNHFCHWYTGGSDMLYNRKLCKETKKIVSENRWSVKLLPCWKYKWKKVTFLLQEGGCHLFGHQKNLDVWTVLGASALFWSCKCLHLFFSFRKSLRAFQPIFIIFLC